MIIKQYKLRNFHLFANASQYYTSSQFYDLFNSIKAEVIVENLFFQAVVIPEV